MNKRIQEFAHRCGFTEYRGDDGADDESLTKFAELIVRECVQTLKDNTPVIDEHDSVEDWDRGYDRAMKDCVHHIQEHFGVE